MHTPADAARAAGLAGHAADRFSHYLLGRLAQLARNADPGAYTAMVDEAVQYARDATADDDVIDNRVADHERALMTDAYDDAFGSVG